MVVTTSPPPRKHGVSTRSTATRGLCRQCIRRTNRVATARSLSISTRTTWTQEAPQADPRPLPASHHRSRGQTPHARCRQLDGQPRVRHGPGRGHPAGRSTAASDRTTPHRIPSHVEPPSSTQLSAATTAAPHSTAASTAATASRPLHPTSINTSCVSAPHESLPRRLHPPRTARPSHTSHHRHQPAHPSANRISRTRARHARPTTLWTHFTDATLHRFCLTDTTHEHRSRTTATTIPPPTHTNQHATQLYTRTASYQPPQRRPPRTLSTLLAGPAVAPHPDTTT